MKAISPFLAIGLAKLNLPWQLQLAIANRQIFGKVRSSHLAFSACCFLLCGTLCYKGYTPMPGKKYIKVSIQNNQTAIITVCKGMRRGK